ncbi:hypothetical protein HPB52_009068 [Rhipicephalus sanguineus]|uniref:Uncharacterized protein n=1 Tax=Rhipicephalus sanguineus TaxID=34632 RepID=A0A9D4Q006_RHISA|nr:hypothetical protein HPB52_009068 [Rhipicephalus sanguineus]
MVNEECGTDHGPSRPVTVGAAKAASLSPVPAGAVDEQRSLDPKTVPSTSGLRSRLPQLFNAQELGDRRPSQLLHRMRQLHGDSTLYSESPLLREFSLQRLPQNLVPVLAAAGDIPLEKLEELADRIYDYSPASPTLASATAMTPDTEVRHSRLEEKVKQLAAPNEAAMLTTSQSPTGTSELDRRRGRLLALTRCVAAPMLHLKCRTGPFPAGNRHTGGSALHGQFGSGVELQHQGCDLDQSRPELLETAYLRIYRGQLERHGLGLLASGPEPDSESCDTSDPRSRLFQPFWLDPSWNYTFIGVPNHSQIDHNDLVPRFNDEVGFQPDPIARGNSHTGGSVFHGQFGSGVEL